MIANLAPLAPCHILLAGNYLFGVKKDSVVQERLFDNLELFIVEQVLGIALSLI